jgi:hypothetical protein
VEEDGDGRAFILHDTPILVNNVIGVISSDLMYRVQGKSPLLLICISLIYISLIYSARWPGKSLVILRVELA